MRVWLVVVAMAVGLYLCSLRNDREQCHQEGREMGRLTRLEWWGCTARFGTHWYGMTATLRKLARKAAR